jgi:hypothetical protein
MTGRPQIVRRDRLACTGCGREIVRRAKQQRYCSARCRNREVGRRRVRKAYLGTDTGAPAHPPKKNSKLKALQRVKTLSSHRIFGPADVLAVELFNRDWKPGISSSGVAIEIGRLPARALVA